VIGFLQPARAIERAGPSVAQLRGGPHNMRLARR
jgi:hypothetical protein